MGKRAARVLAVGLVTGLGWGLGVAVADGLSLLWQGAPWPHLGDRLVALAYLATTYGVLGALLGGTLAALFSTTARLFLGRSGRPMAQTDNPQSVPPSPAPFVLGVLSAGTVLVGWGLRIRPATLGWAVLAILAAAAGLGAVWVGARLGCTGWRGSTPSVANARPGRRGRMVQAVIAAAFLAALATVVSSATVHGLQARQSAQAAAASQPATGRPNILLITAGGIRADHLGVYGYDPAISPNLDALAARGVRFEQAIAPGSWGRPSVAALLTSLYPSALGYHRTAEGWLWPAPDSMRTTLAEALHAAGYRTGAILASPWLNADGFAQGFNTFETARDEEPFDSAPMRGRMLGGLLGCPKNSAACRLYLKGRGLVVGAGPIPAQDGEAINARAARFLDQQSDEPFFLWVHYDDALPPYNLAEPLKPITEDPSASPVERLKNLGYWELGDPFTIREGLLPLDAAGLTALYDGEVQRVDRLAGELLARLEARGLADRTIVVMSSDHGQELSDHGGYTYGHVLYDEIVRVPLIIAGPGITAAGHNVAAAVSLIDVAPTLAELAGTDLSAEAQGASLVPALQGQPIDERPVYGEALYRVPFDQQSIRSGGYKLIYHQADGQVELYDLRADLTEQHNLAVTSPELADALLGQLQQWQSQMRALELTGLPHSATPDATASKMW